jgi:hypothetical protein
MQKIVVDVEANLLNRKEKLEELMKGKIRSIDERQNRKRIVDIFRNEIRHFD